MEYLEKRYGIHGTMPVDMHNMALWAKNPAHPHVPGMMSDLILGINNLNKQRCVLDCPIAVGLPLELAPLDKGQMAWHWTTRDCPSAGPGIHLGSPWTSVSQGGVLIPPHHDSEGRNTYFFPVTGIQLWTLLFRKITCDGKVPLQATKYLCSPHDLDDYDAETMTVYPGGLLIQPPGQLHAEYNPNPAFAHGGHFFTYGMLHHTLSSRSLEVTTQTREYMDETLWWMAALIPQLPPDQLSGLHYWPLLALCFMVLKPRMYLAQRLCHIPYARHRSHHIPTLSRPISGPHIRLIPGSPILSTLHTFCPARHLDFTSSRIPDYIHHLTYLSPVSALPSRSPDLWTSGY
ncbi:uncharacterized protein BJ212DRAFT_1480179 [Suillus subaureus]|uniref:JmjC domain-containing protein n=1 Tax=Suillus subaureus TaxID=48587 RepID=A0A9P7JE07_9AGAM|nr:uncharacterized protein BJ212DRAFT_1480179 [Suillus subaureus]KAG1817624.1 hypothetical protein BJ212DRAFT_1480179 [Suillus subaureus]